MKKILLFLFSVLLVQCNNPNTNEHLTGKVIKVKDGDTIEILDDGEEITIRFAHIDCPEKSQPFSKAAKQFVSDEIYGEQVSIITTGEKDRYGRTIGEVITDENENLNKELVEKGLAWHYKEYSDSKEYSKLESNAQENKIGLWSEPNPTPPWEWRKK